MKAGVDGLPISAKSSFKNSVDHEIDQVGIDFAIVVSQPSAIRTRSSTMAIVSSRVKRTGPSGSGVNERRSAGRAKPSDIFGAKCSATPGSSTDARLPARTARMNARDLSLTPEGVSRRQESFRDDVIS